MIEDQSAQDIPVAQQPRQPSKPHSPSPFDSEAERSNSNALRSSNSNQNSNPYQVLAAGNQHGRRPPNHQYSTSQTDVHGILSVLFGGLSFLSLMLCLCVSPFAIVALAGSVAGLVLSFYSQPPLKLIGMIVNSIVLGIWILAFTAAITLWIMAISGAFETAWLMPTSI
ncbi:hypothetical protein N9Y42_00355 [Mariniblastus sp.]|nr:hypothetical protein [Mariniblastus sp.]